MSKVVAFTGPSNSGKTTLIEKLVHLLAQDFKVVVIKHDPKDKAIFDINGKDSYKFFHSGADVCVISPTRLTTFKHQTVEFKEAIEGMKPFDYLFVEGLKEWQLPRIGVFRGEFDISYTDYIDAIATDGSISELPIKPTRLNLNAPSDILEWINNHAKEI